MPLINGTEYSWAVITATIGGVPVTGFSAISYSSKQAKQNNHGAGVNYVSRSYGAKDHDGAITLHMSEVEAITAKAPNRDLLDIPPFDINLSYLPAGGTVVTHKLLGAEFINNGRDVKQGDNLIEVKLDLVIADIKY